MELKVEFQGLLQQGYAVISDLNKSADMTPKKKILQQNGNASLAKAKEMIKELHQLVDSFGQHLQTFISDVVRDKSEILESHSDEIIQCVDYISNLCIMGENLLKEQDLQVVSSFGPQLKTEFLKSLKECKELKLVDYDTFTSLILEVDFNTLFQSPLVNIVSKNPRNTDKQILHSLGFANVNTSAILGKTQGNDMDRHRMEDSKCNAPGKNGNKYHQVQQTLATIPEKPEHEVTSVNVKIRTEPDSLGNKTNSTAELETKQKLNMTGQTQAASSAYMDSLSDLVQRCEAFGFGSKSEKPITSRPEVQDSGDGSQHSYLTNVRPCYMDQPLETAPPARSGKKADKLDSLTTWKDKQTHVKYCGKSSKDVQGSSSITNSDLRSTNEVNQDRDTYGAGKDNAKNSDKGKSKDEPGNGNAQSSSFTDNSVATHKVSVKQELIDEDWDMAEIESAIFRSNLQSHGGVMDVNGKATQSKEDNQNDGQFSQSSAAVSKQTVIYTRSKPLTKDNTQVSSELWNPHSIEPVKATFDLRTVMPYIRHGLAEIKAEFLWQSSGAVGSPFDHPTGLTVTHDGLLVVADTGNNVVKVLKDNTLVKVIGQNDDIKFVRPSAVVTDNKNNIYVKDDFCVQIFDKNGKHVKTTGQKVFHRPYGLALVKPNTQPFLVVIDAGRCPLVHRYLLCEDRLKSYPYYPLTDYGTDTSKVRFLGVHNNVLLASDLGASHMYLSCTDGQTLKCFGNCGRNATEFWEPSGISVDAVGNWLIGDSKNNRVQVFTNDGHFMALVNFSSPIRRPSGIHLTSDGHLYVINYLDSIVKVYRLCR